MIDDIIVDYYIRMKARRKENRFRRGNFICNCYYIYVQVVVEINFRILSCKVAESILLLSSLHYISSSTEIGRLTIRIVRNLDKFLEIYRGYAHGRKQQ